MRLVLTSSLNPLSIRRGKRLIEHHGAGDLKRRARLNKIARLPVAELPGVAANAN
jgi:hypothetical protein